MNAFLNETGVFTFNKKQMNNIRWWHRIELSPGVFTPGECPHGSDGTFESRFGLPKDFTGKSVLDIGGWDGLFSFEAEKRGAKSVILAEATLEEGGNWGGTAGFNYAKKALNSNVEFINCNVHNLTKDRFNSDVVFFYGVLYHLKNPLHAIEKVFECTNEYALIETAICDSVKNTPVLEFAPGRASDPTNFFYPNIEGLHLLLRFVGFKNITTIYHQGGRATVKAEK